MILIAKKLTIKFSPRLVKQFTQLNLYLIIFIFNYGELHNITLEIIIRIV